ncbi:MAG: alpha/beta fold hydrolase [Bacillota bacterium]
MSTVEALFYSALIIQNGEAPSDSVMFGLHGLGSTGLRFIDVAEELKEDYRIISIDTEGNQKPMEIGKKEEALIL